MESRLRRGTLLLLALIVACFAIAPHQHEGLLGENFARTDTVERVGACDGSSAVHLHAARLVHQHDCLACARQHSVGALRVVAAHAAIGETTTAVVLADHAAAASSVTFAQLRAPPVV